MSVAIRQGSIKYGNILEEKTGLIVHGCNAEGAMGAGLALAIKNKWPSVYARYRVAYQAGELKLGAVIYASVPDSQLVVANAVTQQSTGAGLQTDYDAIRECFRNVAEVAMANRLPVYYPKIGAGLGGGNWSVISRIIDQELMGLYRVNVLLPGVEHVRLPDSEAQAINHALGLERVMLHLDPVLNQAVQALADHRGTPYMQVIRQAIAREVAAASMSGYQNGV